MPNSEDIHGVKQNENKYRMSKGLKRFIKSYHNIYFPSDPEYKEKLIFEQ